MRSIKSDYSDCYDSWFSLPGLGIPVFHRMAQHSWSIERLDMFKAFRRLGLITPAYGRADQFSDLQVVAYTDTLAHCGEGKELGPANIFAPDTLVSLYIPDFPGVSYRYFNICGASAWFKHYSTESWKSNCGDGDLEEVTPRDIDTGAIDEILHGAFLNPVYAIDFVAQRSNSGIKLLAIDFNPAPKLAGTPARPVIETRLHGSRGIARLITDRLNCISEGKDYDNNQIHFSSCTRK
jgi:hypothetical protein